MPEPPLTELLDRAVMSFEASGAAARATLRFTGDEFFFHGHFENQPILPAVVQIAACVHLARRVAHEPLYLREVTRAKFLRTTGPGRELDLVLELLAAEPGRTRVKARMREGAETIAELSLRVSR
jgi:3-hydroxymyristoyl/3-hydroxydecanoyl-(acyl carrier protein) dehydratase